MKSFLFVTALALFGEMAAAAPTHLSHGRFKDLVVYAPAGASDQLCAVLVRR